MQHAPNVSPSTLFSHIFSLEREKIGPPEARQNRPRRNESPLFAEPLFLCARFFLSKPQTEFAVWVLWQICDDLSVCFANCSPGRGALLPRKKVTSIRITTASSIDGSRSKATSYKFDTPVSGGAYQDAREVTSEWNDA